jgi:UDP-arabinose 4-epimerase
LVTGGAGFIGSHVCKALARAGSLPVTFDNLERGHDWAVRWGPLERGDLRHIDDLRQAFRKWRPSAVIHLAAYAYVGESQGEPLKYYENNIGGTAKLLQVCGEFAVNEIVFSSSCATYGVPARLPLTEADPQAPINPYGYTKLAVERMLQDAETALGIRHVVLRYFNAGGADPEGEIGETHDPETHLIPLVLLAASGRQPAIKIFGDDYPTDDGTCVRDYVHVSDLADAHVAAINWLESGEPSHSFNLGNGQGFSVAKVIQMSEAVSGKLVNAEIHPRRSGDPPILISDSRKARRLLGWSPKHPDLRTQIEHAWRWLDVKQPGSSVNSPAVEPATRGA